MPTFRHGKNTVVIFDKYDLSQYFTSATVSAMAEAVETTETGSGIVTETETEVKGLSQLVVGLATDT